MQMDRIPLRNRQVSVFLSFSAYYYMHVYLHLVIPNANVAAFGKTRFLAPGLSLRDGIAAQNIAFDVIPERQIVDKIRA